jgi:hypothetical protein
MQNDKTIKENEKKKSLSVSILKTHDSCHKIGGTRNEKTTKPNPKQPKRRMMKPGKTL